jgi:hypothetical protein
MLYQVLAVVIYLLLCILVAYLGRRRKWGYWGYLWSSVLFTPFFGSLFVLASDPPPRPGKPASEAPPRG